MQNLPQISFENISFEITDQVTPENGVFLFHRIEDESQALGMPLLQTRPLGIFLRDKAGDILAGLAGKYMWNWLDIQLLWVSPSLRRQGIGTRLIQSAEEEARKRGCAGGYVWTQSWQAQGFYEKQGYSVFVTFPDFPVGHQRMGLRKFFDRLSLS